MTTEYTPDAIPESPIEIARQVLGNEFYRLQIAYGGQRLYIPTWERLKKRRRAKLRIALGDATTQRLCLALSGEEIYIPMIGSGVKYTSLDRVQNRRIQKLIEGGRSKNDIVARLGISNRTVQRKKQKISG